jgi:hypothetical protein
VGTTVLVFSFGFYYSLFFKTGSGGSTRQNRILTEVWRVDPLVTVSSGSARQTQNSRVLNGLTQSRPKPITYFFVSCLCRFASRVKIADPRKILQDAFS